MGGTRASPNLPRISSIPSRIGVRSDHLSYVFFQVGCSLCVVPFIHGTPPGDGGYRSHSRKEVRYTAIFRQEWSKGGEQSCHNSPGFTPGRLPMVGVQHIILHCTVSTIGSGISAVSYRSGCCFVIVTALISTTNLRVRCIFRNYLAS